MRTSEAADASGAAAWAMIGSFPHRRWAHNSQNHYNFTVVFKLVPKWRIATQAIRMVIAERNRVCIT